MANESASWEPLDRERFGALDRGQQLRDRHGRVWTITGPAREEHGLVHVIMRSGDLVRRVNERYADDYMLVEGGG